MLDNSRTPSLDSLLNLEDDFSQDEFSIEADDEFAWMDKELYTASDRKIGETIHGILNLFFTNGLTKDCLENILNFLNWLLPQPNN